MQRGQITDEVPEIMKEIITKVIRRDAFRSAFVISRRFPEGGLFLNGFLSANVFLSSHGSRAFMIIIH